MRLPDSLDVFRQREFRLLWAGQAVSGVGDGMMPVAASFAALEVSDSTAAVGIVLACFTVPLVGSVLVGGVVADRVSRRAVMVAADLVRVASQGATAALLITGSAELWTLGLLASVSGAATGFFTPAATGLLPRIVSPERLQHANALRATATSAGEIVGPLSAGLLVAAAGAGWAMAIDAGTFAVSAVCLMAMRVAGRAEREPSTFLADLRDGWTAFRSRTWVWTFVVYFAVANVFWGAWMALGPVVAERDLGGAAAWGTVLAAFGVGALAGSLVATRVSPSRPLLFVACTEALFALPLAFLAALTAVPVLAVGALLSGAGATLGMSVWESTLQRHIPDEWLSRVASFDWFGSFAFYPLGLAAWGPIAATIGISLSLWLAFGLFIACVLALLTVPDVRRLPAYPPPEPAGLASKRSLTG
jgi:MFS family permease